MRRAAAILGGVLLLGSGALVQAQSTSNQQNPVYSFSTPGTHQVTLTACNNAGCNTVTKTVTVLDPKPAIVSAVLGAATVDVGQLVPLTGSGTGKPPLAYTWRVLLGATVVREVPGSAGWLDTTGLAPGAYTVVLRIANGSGEALSLPLPLVLVPAQELDFYTVAPCRMLDTRIGEPLQSGVTRVVSVDGACEIPPGARALAINVTAIGGSNFGSLILFPGNYPVPGTSTANFRAGAVIANNAVLPLSSDGLGKLALFAVVAGDGTVHAAVDVFGYFAPAVP